MPKRILLYGLRGVASVFFWGGGSNFLYGQKVFQKQNEEIFQKDRGFDTQTPPPPGYAPDTIHIVNTRLMSNSWILKISQKLLKIA